MSSFDKLCWFAERFPDLLGPSLVQMLRQTHLFRFPHAPHEVLPKSYSEAEAQFQNDYFVLPFRTVAIEDLSSCILLWDDVPDQTGMSKRRWFVELAPLSSASAAAWRDGGIEADVRKSLPTDVRAEIERSFNFSFGQIEVQELKATPSDGSWSFAVGGDLIAYHMLDENGPTRIGMDLLRDYGVQVAENSIRNAMTAIEELMLFNRPDRFIVRESPVRTRDPNSPKIPRSHERDVYTLLRPQEARTKLGLPELTGRSGRFVGERRRHVRRYPDDPERWPNAHGKTIIVPATWVGPHEAVVGRRKFTIMLDL